jgi:hypothetical protein
MQVCKNRNSGKYFIYLQDTGNNESLLITPSVEIKSLHADLFDDLEDKEESSLIADGLISEAQVQRLRQYEKESNENNLENISYLFDQLSPYQLNRVREFIRKQSEAESKLKDTNMRVLASR